MAIQRVITSAGEAQLKGLISQHAAKTGSAQAKALLADWEAAKGRFWQLVPPAEKVRGRGRRCLQGAGSAARRLRGDSPWREGMLHRLLWPVQLLALRFPPLPSLIVSP